MRDVEMAICREYHFDSAHRLEWHPGRCKNLHGHTYKLQVWVSGNLDERGVVMDFEELDEIVRSTVTNKLDHQYLNDLIENPTAERIALWVLEQLESTDTTVSEIRLWETPRSAVSVTPLPR